MVVVTINEGHTHVGAAQGARGVEAAETAADNYDMRLNRNLLLPMASEPVLRGPA